METTHVLLSDNEVNSFIMLIYSGILFIFLYMSSSFSLPFLPNNYYGVIIT